jgi:hypothetical protein
VARGIEDLQVEYLDGTGVWRNQPSAVDPTLCGQGSPTPASCAAQAINMTRQVRVTLSARSMAPVMLGAVRDGNNTVGSEALRGQLQAVITPRAAKVGLGVP